MMTIRLKVTILKKKKSKKIMRFRRYNGFLILSIWCYYRKSEFFENFSRLITPWPKNIRHLSHGDKVTQ